MSRGRYGVPEALVLGCLVLWGAPASGASPSPFGGPDRFEIPLIALAPTVTAKAQAGNGDVLFEQPLRPAGAVRLKADLAVHITNSSKGDLDLAVPAGTVFVKAVSQGAVSYCAARSAVAFGFWGGLDLGLCLSDAQNDGVFETLTTVDHGANRIRGPLELTYPHGVTVPIAAPYEPVAPEQAPLLKLHVVFYNDGKGLNHFLFRDFETVALEVCWPPELSIADPENAAGGCDATDWESSLRPRDNFDVIARRYRVSTDAGATETATWGPLSIVFTGLENRQVSAHVEGALPAGPLTSSVQNALFLGTDLQHELYILHLQPADLPKENL
jgi:hypothetical protein